MFLKQQNNELNIFTGEVAIGILEINNAIFNDIHS